MEYTYARVKISEIGIETIITKKHKRRPYAALIVILVDTIFHFFLCHENLLDFHALRKLWHELTYISFIKYFVLAHINMDIRIYLIYDKYHHNVIVIVGIIQCKIGKLFSFAN